ncbi:hypothetical protein AVEN_126204-1 [Araneus ventricosus]|uniref:Uncharacterized protein n=1 Tax=Araneus ventricosus TaxID=182803 RepID=A0A4Y2IUZ4_ARAVE|nr:hypothetical protein AVEN_126204-1 [Araneus ventricosus]
MGSLSFVDEANSSTRYMLISTPNTFHTVSPFLVQKLLTSCIGERQNVKKLRSDDLLVQVDSKQASVISKLTNLGTLVAYFPTLILNMLQKLNSWKHYVIKMFAPHAV